MGADHPGDIGYTPGMGFGLGFAIREHLGRAAQPGSAGWDGAYYSQSWVDPKGRLTRVYMVQLIPAGTSDAHGKLRSLLYQALK